MSLITAYNPLPISFTHGQGIWLYDEQGNAYLDSFSGIAVCGLGHSHPAVTQAIQQQAAKLLHVSNSFHIKAQEELAAHLIQLTGMEQVFFGNSGAEANEAAIKLTRLFAHKKGIERSSIIVMERAFHGRTMATLSASGSRKVQAGFEPLVPGFIRAPFNDLQALQAIAAHREDVVAIMLEPIQGEGGIFAADESYLRAVSELCDANDWLFILDEIQTGNARTGKFFSYMHAAIEPDIVTTAKGLGNGMPISACLMRGKACDLFKPGNHGSTFGGNPLACTAASAVLKVIEEENICDLVMRNSSMLKDRLLGELGHEKGVRSIRGKGYMLGIELDRSAAGIREIGLQNALLLNVTADTVIRLLPPLIITIEEIENLIARLVKTLKQFLQ